MSTIATKEERLDYIVEAIKDGSFNNNNVSELFGVSKNTIKVDLHELSLAYPQIKHNGKRGSGSKWTWVDDVEDGHKYSVKKTEEGYNDPTAAAVITKLDNDIYGEFTPGDVWWVSASNGTTEKYLVIQSFAGCTTCLQVISRDRCNYNPAIHTCVNIQYNEVVDCRRLISKPSRYFLEKDAAYSVTNFDAIRRKIVSLNKLDVTLEDDLKVKEKIVEKKVEVPVEVIKEVPVEKIVEKRVEVPVTLPSDDTELALAKQRADIYEQVAWSLLRSIRGSEEVIV